MLAGRGRGKIRAPRRSLANQNDAVDFETMWGELSSSLREIHTKNASKLSFEELYRNAYKLVLKKKGETLYERVKQFEQEWLAFHVRTRIDGLVSPSLLTGHGGASGNTTVNEKRAAGERFLKALKQAWEDHILCMNMTTDVLMYMDRVYCTDHRRPSIFTASMGLFRDYVLRSPISLVENLTIAAVLNSVILEQIQMEREGDIIDKNLIRSCVYMLEGLYENEDEEESSKLYLTVFEPDFLRVSRDFYQSEAASLLRNTDAGTYCRHSRKRVDEEQDRCRSTLSPLTSPKIKSVVEDELVRKHIREVIELEGSGVKYMLDNDRVGELGMVYDLISRVDPKKEELRKALQKRVVELGGDVNQGALASTQASTALPTKDPAEKVGDDWEKLPALPRRLHPTGQEAQDSSRQNNNGPAEKATNLQTAAAIKWVDDVLQLKDKYDRIWTEAFSSDPGLQTALTRSFSDFINAFSRSSEYLSLFFDENMKKGLKGKTENEVDIVLDKGVTLLRYIQDKDMFERYYKKHLSKRLLMKRSVSMDAERQMVSKMKMEVGNTFTQRIEAMFKDMAVSEDLSASYKSHVARLGDPDPKRVELDVQVLTSTMWPMEAMGPSYKDGEAKSTCIFPTQIDRVKLGFEKFYLDKHSGRQLTWQANMGSADIRAYFPESKGKIKTRELNVSTYAMVILLLFNDLPPGESFTFEEIQGRTNIPTNELIRNLQSLAVAPKTRVLIKDPMGREVQPNDRFFFNESFYSNFTKIKIGVVSNSNRVEADEERKETEKKNNDTRGGIIEAAVVRIMKQRKELSHQQLITEVIGQLASRFVAEVNMVKKRIESLIEREYLERLEDVDKPTYRYLA